MTMQRPVVLVSVSCPVHGQKLKARPPWHLLLGSLPAVVDENLLAMPQLCAECGREVVLKVEPVAEEVGLKCTRS
jgi:hypothetical protein